MKSSLRSFFGLNIPIIFFLGISSGLPLALVLSTLKVFLTDLNFDIKTIGFFSLIALPYSLKFLWAPMLDFASIPCLTKYLGKRKSWMIFTQLLLIFSIAGLGFFSQYGIVAIAIIAILIAIFSATQDMVIDAYRIEAIKTEDQGFAASFYVYGYRMGMLISGAGALVLSEKISWDKVYYSLSAVMLVGILTTLFAKENLQKTKAKHNFKEWVEIAIFDPVKDFFERKNWFLIFPFIILFKLCDAFAGSITLPFLLQIGFSKTEIATIVKTFGLFATLGGALLGGILVKELKLTKSLWIALILQTISNLGFCYQAMEGHNVNTLYWVIFIENFSGGIGDAVFVAYLSSLCNVAFTATQYAILVSLASLARAVLSSSAGLAAADFGWINFFFFSSTLALPALVILFFLNRASKR
ncbi:MAG: transporter [Rickettsiaceae bacterium]|jgi:PAT family beta-lactamase induction signal transducer AmpG|nr:transporter [Rickettsiaceae bacterium]